MKSRPCTDRHRLFKYKGDRCAHCGDSIKSVLARFGTIGAYFHFDHVEPAKKAKNYRNLIRRIISSEVLDEVDKCVLLCSNCHSILHGQNINGNLSVTLRVRGKTYKQTIKGQYIYDKKANRMTFLTNEMINIFPCWIQFKDRPKRLTVFRELGKQLFKSWIKKLKVGGGIGVFTYHCKFVAELTRPEENTYCLLQLISFPLMEGEFRGDDGNIVLWVRRGMAIWRNGDVSTKGTIKIEFPKQW